MAHQPKKRDGPSSKGKRVAANEALEPAHAVICRLLQTGANFGEANVHRPFHLATQAVAPLCLTPDVDGVISQKSARTSAGSKAGPLPRAPTLGVSALPSRRVSVPGGIAGFATRAPDAPRPGMGKLDARKASNHAPNAARLRKILHSQLKYLFSHS